MDYLRSSPAFLVRGPLLFTPQGWTVLATAAGCWTLAAVVWLTGSPVLISGGTDRGLLLLLAWPLLVFMFYLRLCMPHFQASWRETAYLAVAALSLPAYSLFEAW